MRTHLFVLVALPLALAATLLACGDEPERPTSSDRESRDNDDDDNNNNNNSGQADDCYDNGWWDCEDYNEPEPDYWDCGGSYEDDYWDGYCACEDYYADWYYCY